MRSPIFVRPLTDAERDQVAAGLRSTDRFTLRRSQVIQASERGQTAPVIAQFLGCPKQTVLNAINDFNRRSAAALRRRVSPPPTPPAAFKPASHDRLREILHRSPRAFGKPTSVWTLPLVAEVAFAEGLTETRVAGETVRATLVRLGIRWQRAKHWITSPDPAYARKKAPATD